MIKQPDASDNPSPNHHPDAACDHLQLTAEFKKKPIADLQATVIMAAMFSQNPLLNGPNYSFSDTPKAANGEFREHRFNP